MNILIIGGLVGFAVVALLGAVMLGIGDDRAEKARKAQEAAVQSQASQSGQLAPSTLPAVPTVSRATAQLAPSLDEEHPMLHRSGHLVVPNEEERLLILDGQVHEITSELRALAHKASELELRLSSLSEVLERQPYQQVHQSGNTDQFYAPRTDTSSL